MPPEHPPGAIEAPGAAPVAEAALLLRERSLARGNVSPEQPPDGSYRPVRRALTDRDLTEHIRGLRTLATYALDVAGRVDWFAFALDAPDAQMTVHAQKGFAFDITQRHDAGGRRGFRARGRSRHGGRPRARLELDDAA